MLLAAAALGIVRWRLSGPSKLALLRILPPAADLYALADLESLQRNPAVRRLLSDPTEIPAELSVEEDYRRFVEGSGFRYQDGLRQLAVAKVGSNWVGTARIAVDRARILQYLEDESSEKTEVQGQTVFVFGQVRPLRLALPERDLAIFTIGEDNTLITKSLQQHSEGSGDSAASELAQAGDLTRISQGAALWIVVRTERLLNQSVTEQEAGPFRIGGPLLRGSQTLYLTVQSRLTQLEFQVENRCVDEASAERFARMAQSLLVLLRAVPLEEPDAVQGKLAALLRDIAVQRVAESVLLQWQWDAETLRVLE